MDNSLKARSPPPAQLDDEAPRPLPSLPTEILQRIIQLALPRLSFTTFRERYSILLTLCRVNKLWAALAQEELYRHVCCRTTGRSIDALCAVKRQKEVTTHSLWLRGKAPFAKASREMSAFGRLTMLYVTTSETDVKLTVSSSTLLLVKQGLQVLALDYSLVDLGAQPSVTLFPRLRRLALSCFPHPADMTEFLRTTSFPLLNELSITCGEDWSGEEVTDLSNSIIALGPQLLSFSFTSIGSDFTTVLLPEVWPALTSVQHLTLHHNDNLPDILPLVRSSLVSFRLRAPVDEIEDMEFNFGALLEALAEPPAALNTLQHLTIPPIDPDYEREEEDDADDPLASSLQVVQTICRHRGIKISYAPDQRHARFMEHIEDEVTGDEARSSKGGAV